MAAYNIVYIYIYTYIYTGIRIYVCIRIRASRWSCGIHLFAICALLVEGVGYRDVSFPWTVFVFCKEGYSSEFVKLLTQHLRSVGFTRSDSTQSEPPRETLSLLLSFFPSFLLSPLLLDLLSFFPRLGAYPSNPDDRDVTMIFSSLPAHLYCSWIRGRLSEAIYRY